MKRTALVLGAVGLVALTVALPLGAAAGTGTAPIAINSKASGSDTCDGRFTLSTKGIGDSGHLTCKRTFSDKSVSTPGGLPFTTISGTDTLTGKVGTLVLRFRGRIFTNTSYSKEVWMGTWSIVHGTGKYARLAGGGDFVAISKVCCTLWNQYAGHVTGL